MKRTQHICIALFVILIALPMPIQVVRDLLRHQRIQALDVFRRPPTTENLRTYEHDLDRDLVAAVPARRWYADGWDRVARRGNAKVVETADGWMFHYDDLLFASAPGLETVDKSTSYGIDTEPNEAFDVILDFKRELAAQGASLVIVAVPSKATIEAQHLLPDAPTAFAPNNSGLARFLARLRTQGVDVIELTDALAAIKASGKEPFLERDTHWTPQAAKAAGRLVATRLRQRPGARQDYPPQAPFRHMSVAYERKGDLHAMLSYASPSTKFPLMPFIVEQVIAGADGNEAVGDESSPILVLGDSFSVIYSDISYGMGERGGFPDHLADALLVPVDVIAIPGAGANRAREALALRGLGPKKVVVWELAERTFLDRDTPWKRVALPPAGTFVARSSEAKTIRVQAVLRGVSHVPAGLPYPDCMAILRYDAVNTWEIASPFYVATWGRRDFKDVPPPSPSVNVVQELTLVPLGADHALGHTCFTDQVGMNRTPYWAEKIEAVP